MIIQINTASSIKGSKDYEAKVSQLLEKEFAKYSTHITRIEVHLSDEDGSDKNGPNSRKCILEARVEGKQPIAVTSYNDTNEKAVHGAIKKLNAALRPTLEQMKEH
jgi:hypothetical protein